MRSQTPVPELPTLTSEVYCLHADRNTRSVLASLVVDHALLNGGPVYWVDALNHAATDPIAAVAPSPRILDRIHVARGFTPYQHHSIAESLAECLSKRASPSVIVAPSVDAHYTEAGAGIDGDSLLARTLARLVALGCEYDCPVLLTTVDDRPDEHPVTAAGTAEIRCEQTAHGPRFVGEDFETLVYPVGNGLVQTTFAFWQSVIDARRPIHQAHTGSSHVGVTG